MDIQKDIQELQAIADEQGLQLKGRIQVFVKRAKTGIEELLVDQENTIQNDLKDVMRDVMHSNADFALDNLQATQVAQASLSASLNGKDGLLVYSVDSAIAVDNALGFMASAVHPTTPTGDSPYFRQWQGVYQNLTGSTETAKSAEIGQNYTQAPTADPPFDANGISFARSNFADVTLLDNDIITINWKITVG